MMIEEYQPVAVFGDWRMADAPAALVCAVFMWIACDGILFVVCAMYTLAVWSLTVQYHSTSLYDMHVRTCRYHSFI